MRIKPLISKAGTPHFGIEILDFDVANAPDEAIRDLGRRIADRLVVVIRGAHITKERHWLLIRKIGQIHGIPRDYPTEIDPDESSEELIEWHYQRNGRPHLPGLVRISGIRDEQGRPTGFFAEGELRWHMNQAAVRDALPCVGLHAAEGTEGSVTEFLETHTLYTSLEPEFLARIADLEVVHRWRSRAIAPELNERQDTDLRGNMFSDGSTEPRIPLVWRSPGGRVGIRFSPYTYAGFHGLDPEASEALRAELWARMQDPRLHYRHEWQDGDLVFMDNTITLHRRLGRDTSRRLIHRVAFGYNEVLPDQPDYPLHGHEQGSARR